DAIGSGICRGAEAIFGRHPSGPAWAGGERLQRAGRGSHSRGCMNVAETDAWLNTLLARAYAPRPDETTLEWAAKNAYIPPSVSPQWPGYYTIDPSPCVDILFQFFD